MDIFSALNKEEIEKLQLAPALVTILVGASDGKLDGEERTWSENLLRARGYAGNQALQEFYRVVSEGFWVELQHQMSILPSDTTARNSLLIDQLKELNPVLAKLSPVVAYNLYKGLLGLAEEVAKASGGFLRIGAISESEHDLLNLSMLTPIEAPAVLVTDQQDLDAHLEDEQSEE